MSSYLPRRRCPTETTTTLPAATYYDDVDTTANVIAPPADPPARKLVARHHCRVPPVPAHADAVNAAGYNRH